MSERQKALQRAYRRLAKIHSVEFSVIYNEERAALGLRPPLDRGPPKRGSRSCYVTGCKHPECETANRAYQREYMRLFRAGVKLTDITRDSAR